ncbi:L,D-transpeptidase family protein [Longivirga aurantiaca]|uniref:L,D-transpeptidase family protein n=1 Tax=Longivirga aurantiaca TaxID=1837743 RepID=A0ABW1T2D8_9ACTN
MTRRPRLCAALAVAAAAVTAFGLLGASGPASAQVVAPTAVPLPADIGQLPSTVKQLVTVEGGYTSTYATVTAWARVNGSWVVRMRTTGRVGYSGLSDMGVGIRRQSDGTTPTGLYKIGYGFGTGSNPGTSMWWRRFDRNDYWSFDARDPKTYNVFQTQRPATAYWRAYSPYSEHLYDLASEYQYAFLINFNLPKSKPYQRADGQWVTSSPANTARGGGIFLHVNGSGATAGCVSVPRDRMLWLTRWFGPAYQPHIAIGTTSLIRSL